MSSSAVNIGRLERAIETVAQLSLMDPIYLPIFARLDWELETARAAADPIARARALMQSRAIA
jgi:hypothetical protein